MSQPVVIVVVTVGIVVLDTLFAWALIRLMLKAGWSALAQRYPGVEPASDAVRKGFQSFKVGHVRLGKGVHVAADDAHLHLMPVRFIRWFGARAMSVPWEAIRITGEALGGRLLRARIDSVNVLGPAWCLGLAARAPQGDGPDAEVDTPADLPGDEGLFEEVDRATD